MTRLEAKANLEALGLTEVTDEMITNYLNQVNGETKKYSDKVAQGKIDAEKVADLQAKLEAIENQNLSDIEKANKDTERANQTIADLQSQIKGMQLKTSLAEKGIIGEEADKLIASIGSGSLDVELLGQIISNRETLAAQAKEKEIADNSTNPGGGSAGGDDAKPLDVLNAESMANAFGTKAESDKQNYYVLN